MKIALVTAFPPSRHGLNEYGFHIAEQLRQHPGLELTVLGDDLAEPGEEIPGFSVIRCWGFNRLGNPVSLLRTINRLKPDVVWYNLGFASFGGKPLPAFFGLTTPALTRLCSCYTHVTLHQLFETVNLSDAGVKSPVLYKLAGRVATHFLLSANSVSVLLPAYHKTLREKYQRGRVNIRHHGIFASRPEPPNFALRGDPIHRILAFGKWGTYKRLEALVAAYERVVPQLPPSELVIAGGDHPKTPGYVHSVARDVRHNRRIRFLGYVPENDLADLFRTASLTVLPYTSSAGSSGVAHLACQYGLPILAPDIEDFVELAQQEQVSMEFFSANSVDSMADQLVAMFRNPERLRVMAQGNFSAALQMSMPQIIREYTRSFDMHQRVRMLKSYSRLRRARNGIPGRRWMMRQIEKDLSARSR
ncbi:MAG TPA: glycosyltransferase [Terriglobales bacterium]|nr:glycosyltransferase [Terriglobales bacterium]